MRLSAELARRCSENPSYSLRAFAAWLDMDHSTLSQLLRRKRRLTEETIRRLGRKLRLEEIETARYAAAQEVLDRASQESLIDLELEGEDAQRITSEWEHAALLELTRLDTFRTDSRWIGRVLGVGTDRANTVLQRLLRLRLLEMTHTGVWADRSRDKRAPEVDRPARRVLLKESHRLCLAELDGADRAAFEHLTVALDSDRLDEARAAIARLRHELLMLSESSEVRDGVHRLDLRFFPLTSLNPKTDKDPHA